MSFHDNARSGLTLRDPGTTGNQVLDSDFYRNYDPAGEGRAEVGLAIKFGSGVGNLVRGCRAFHHADAGFDVGHFEDSVTLERNWAYGNGVNRWGADPWRANADGFHLGGGGPPPAAAHVLRHNAALGQHRARLQRRRLPGRAGAAQQHLVPQRRHRVAPDHRRRLARRQRRDRQRLPGGAARPPATRPSPAGG